MRRRRLSLAFTSLRLQLFKPTRAVTFFICLANFTLLTPCALAQQNSAIATRRHPETNLEKQLSNPTKRQQVVALIKEFANRTFAFENLDTKILSIAHFADLLWNDDEASARDLFNKSLEFCLQSDNSLPAGTDRKSQLRLEVLALLARHDASRANRLIGEYRNASFDTDSGATDLQIANRLLKTQPNQAVQFAEQRINSGISFDLVFFLLRLRAVNESKANSLFLQVLNHLAQEQCVDPEMLILLGTYVYTFPTVSGEAITPSTIKYIGIGPVLLPDITQPRAGVSPQLILAYLTAATEVLGNQLCSSDEKAKLYAASYLLLNKTSVAAPDLAARISLTMQTVRQDVPPELLEDSNYKAIESDSSKTLAETLTDIEKKLGLEARDNQYFVLVYDLWRRSDFQNARLVNQRISDTRLRERLSGLITFRECAQIIETEGKADEVERLISTLTPGIERALSRLGLAQLYARKRNRLKARESINAALVDARRLDDPRAPFIMLAAAREFACIKSADATPLFTEAINRLNLQNPEEQKNLSWRERLSSGMLDRDWPLEIKGVTTTFRMALPDLMRADSHVVVETTLKLKNEAYLSEALLEVASVLLNTD
jgi:hypothetical protein